ncbi:MAG: nucleotidyl transferase AbiEii/AbiGii toxin family protein [Actinomycetota bacterium]
MTRRISLEPKRIAVDPPEVDERVFLAVLDDTVTTLEEAGIPFGLLGGVASATLGRPRFTRDVDVFVRPEEARRALVALAANGFATEETDAHWIFKAFKHGVLVDIVFRAKWEIYLDDEMIERSVRTTFHGHVVRTIPREDLCVIKAIIYDEATPRHWFDALSLIAAGDLDWEYLTRRAIASGGRRVLSLLLYATSIDLVVPDAVIRDLFEVVISP